MKNIGRAVKMLRSFRLLSQAQLAGMCGVARTQITNIENGRSRSSVDTLEAIAVATGVTLSDLIFLATPASEQSEERMRVLAYEILSAFLAGDGEGGGK